MPQLPLPMAGQFVALGAVLVLGLVIARAAGGNAGPVLFVAAVFILYYGFRRYMAAGLTMGGVKG